MNAYEKPSGFINRFKARNKQESVSKSIPDHAFETCSSCHESLVLKDLSRNLYVCPFCGSHLPVSARERIRQVTDPFSFRELEKNVKTENRVNFEGYDEKLEAAMKSTGMKEACITGTARIGGIPCAIAVMDKRFMMASMGSVVGEKMTRLIEAADEKSLPLIVFCASGGARMQEGILSLVQMAKTSAALEAFGRRGNLYLSVLTDPTTGGVSASFAMLGDIILAEPNALIGFAGRRVIEKTISEKLPPEFQRAEFLQDRGFVDLIVQRKEMKTVLHRLLALHGKYDE
ncbi:MAG: acetyl-CoA carboxylase carboxyltransferase subunit beta [Erysipelotrichaceae bacterium]|nr:acetyl-CoA carboxylase carboxyltransferase subunit beta [Erysipelotrichaceae bacterium]